MILKKIVSLLTCSSLVFGTILPLHTLVRSKRSAFGLEPLALVMDDIEVNQAVSAQTNLTIVDDQSPGTPQAECGSIVYGQTVTGYIAPYGEDQCFTFYGQAGDEVSAQLTSPIGTEFTLELKWPYGDTDMCYSYQSCLIEAGILLVSGTYTLTVGASGSYSGEYSLTLGSR